MTKRPFPDYEKYLPSMPDQAEYPWFWTQEYIDGVNYRLRELYGRPE